MEIGLSKEHFKEELLKRYPEHAELLFNGFEHYLKRLIEVNTVMNLTAITEAFEIREKHFLDCMMIEAFIPENSTIADVGSGAGFPGLVLALLRPDCQIDLIEPTTKRCTFLNQMKEELQLKNVSVLNRRAEDCEDKKEAYDVVTARAVANLSILMELCVPLLKTGGNFIAMKGSSALDELKNASHAMSEFSLNSPQIESFDLPHAGQRINLIFTKTHKSPSRYPRAYRYIKKNPL